MSLIAREVIPMRIEDEMRLSYTRYAMSVIVGRALPDARDGLKPVHRRILYAMFDQNMTPDRRREKCASAVGEVLKNYHPHGDQSVYDALVRMAQDFSMRYPLIDGQGNFGCFTGDTKIKLLDGSTASFQELSRLPAGESFAVYAVDKTGHIVVGRGHSSRITRRDAELVELTFDDGTTVRCTPDHRFMLRDGSWKQAQYLGIDDSLMAGYFDTAPINERTRDYLRVLQPANGEWTWVHRLADAYNLQNGQARKWNGPFVRHHKNGDRFDNRPENIERMDWLEHLHLHAAQMREMWTRPAFRQAQREGVLRYFEAHPAAREARRKTMRERNRDAAFRRANGARVSRALKARHRANPLLAVVRGEHLRELWQDADYRLRMSAALRGIEKRPLTPAQKKRVARIIGEKSRAMWSDDAKRRDITQAIISALSDPQMRARMSERSRGLWRDEKYRARFAPDHHRRMAQVLWAKPETREMQRAKIALQWQTAGFRAAHARGRKRDWQQRQIAQPDMMSQLAQRAAISLREKWGDEDYARRVMRTKIAGYTARLLAQHGREQMTPQLYDESRCANWIPNSDKALRYFDSFDELLSVAATHNHRVVSLRRLETRADVYDITVDEHHNFMLANGCIVHNSVDGDPAAAYRYTEARLAPIAMELLRDLEMETVDFQPNFSESTSEPSVLPSVYPNLLVNGSAGIAVGMATNIPPHNLGEVCDAVAMLVENPESSIEELMTVMPGPDFPTAGLILGRKGISDAYHTGRGSVIMQARATIEPIDHGREAILITEIPYQVNKATLIENIARLYREKRIEGISEMRDESDRNGMRIVIELKREANAHVVLNFLYKHTALRTSFGIINLSLLKGEPKVLSLKECLQAFVEHREEVIKRRSAFQLRKAEARAHILEGFRAILASIDDVIALIRSSQSREDARNKLMNEGVPRYVEGRKLDELVTLSEIQANAVLDMRLGQLTQLDRMKIDDEYAELIKEIERLQGILEDVRKVRGIIRNDMARIKKEYGNVRRTRILDQEAQNIRLEDLIADEDVVITITRDGYIKKLPMETYRTQGRGGRGIVGLTKKEEDSVEHLFVCSTHNTLMIFTNRGKVYQLRAYEVPSASRTGRGTPIVNLLQVERGEIVTAALNVKDFSPGRYLFMVTKEGTIKKTTLSDYATKLAKGLIAIRLEGKDELRFVFLTDGQKEIILASRKGMSIRFGEGDVRSTGRATQGVTGMRFSAKSDYIVGAAVASPDDHVLTISELGLGKRSLVSEYREQSRGGKGVMTLKVTERTGELVSLQVVKPDEQLMIITAKGIVIRQGIDEIRETGRVAQGVKLIRLEEGDRVAAVAKILQELDRGVGDEGAIDGDEIDDLGEVAVGGDQNVDDDDEA